MKLMYRNLRAGKDNGCDFCKNAVNEILSQMEKRERIEIIFNPVFNASGYFESYHIDVPKNKSK